MKTVLKNCRVLGTTHDKDMLHDIYVENGIIEKIGLNRNGFPCGTARRLYNDYLRTEYRPCH